MRMILKNDEEELDLTQQDLDNFNECEEEHNLAFIASREVAVLHTLFC